MTNHFQRTWNMSNLPAQQNFISGLLTSSPSSTTSGDIRIPRPPTLAAHPVFSPAVLNTLRGHGHGHSHTAGQGHDQSARFQPGISRLMNMEIRIPVPLSSPPLDGSQPFVVNVENAGSSASAMGASALLGQSDQGSGSADGGPNQDAPLQPGSLSSLKDVIKSLEGVLPFIILIFAKIMYEHRLGILIFVAMYGTFFHANSSLRKLIMQRDVHNSLDHMGNLVWIVGFLTANIFFFYYVFDDQKLYKSLYFSWPEVGDMTVWNLLWVVGTTDFIIKYSTVLFKALITALPRQILPFRKKGRFYLLVEILSQFYRSVVPIVPWVYFLEGDAHEGKWFFMLLLLLYIVCKGADIFGRIRELRKGFKKFQSDLSYGNTPNQTQLDSYDNSCPMCLDKFRDPICLSCTHIFCEECISKWFNQERTCPMCRANIVHHPQWRDGSTSTTLQLW